MSNLSINVLYTSASNLLRLYVNKYKNSKSMQIVNYSEARRNFKVILDQVANDQDCTILLLEAVLKMR